MFKNLLTFSRNTRVWVNGSRNSAITSARSISNIAQNNSRHGTTRDSLNEAITSFCLRHQVTPDIVLPVIALRAKVFYAECLVHPDRTNQQVWADIAPLSWRPWHGAFEVYSKVKSNPKDKKTDDNILLKLFDRDRVCLKFNDSKSNLGTEPSNETKLWYEIFKTYSLYLLRMHCDARDNLVLMQRYETSRQSAFVEFPIRALINNVLARDDHDLIETILLDPNCKRAYSLETPVSGLNFNTMLNELNKILADFKLEVELCSIFPQLISGLIGKKSLRGYYSQINSTYEAQKHDFELGLLAPKADVQALIVAINRASATDSASLKKYQNGCGVISLSFHFVEKFVLEYALWFLKNNPALVTDARREYLENSRLYPDAKFAQPQVQHTRSTPRNKPR
jgi:hypothetical protein